ncbi:MAG: UvrB/UvrC motif-containing protein [Opitutia bacterium]|jgi:protein arginine kinase activator
MPGHPCDRCGAPATLFLAQVAGEQSAVVALCAGCAPQGLAAAPLPASAAGLSVPIPLPPSRAPCPACGFRWPDFDRHQRLGCPECYESHAAQSRGLVARTQPALAHQGRRPGAPVAPLQREMEGLRSAAPARPGAAELEARLAKAILEENYEEAARLRDLLASRTPPA